MSGNNNQKKKASKPQKPGAAKKQKVTGSKKNTNGWTKHVNLGQATLDYARSLANPKSGPMAAVPNKPAQMSKKVRNFVRFTFNTQSADGLGWVYVDTSRGVVNDTVSVYASAATGVNPAAFRGGVGVVNVDYIQATSNSELVTASLGPGTNQFQYRLVSCSLAVRYQGTKLNQGGTVAGFMDPDHNSIGNRSTTDLLGEEQCYKDASEPKLFRVLYRPVHNQDFDFSSSLPTFTAPGLQAEQSFFLGIFINAPTGALSASYEVEVFWNYELMGKTIRGTTPSHVDNVGFNAVHAVSQLGSTFRQGYLSGSDMEKKIVQEVAHYVATQMTSSQTNTSTLDKGSQSLLGDAAGTLVGAGVSALFDWFF